MKVAILDDYLDVVRSLACFERLAAHEVTVFTDHVQDDALLAERLAETEALVLIRERTRIGAGLIARLPRLRLISQRSAYPHIDVSACTAAGVVVSSNLHTGAPSYAAAELTWALVMAAMRRLPQQVSALRAGQWQSGIGHTLRGKTFGVFGYGRIGAAVAGYARAFGMEVLAWGQAGSRERAAADGVAVADSQTELFERADVVSVHLRLVEATRGVVGAADFARMKTDALFVNTSRAGLVAPGALEAALRDGRPGMAAVDVFEAEPVTGAAYPLLAMDNVVATPHIGYVTLEEFELQFADIFDQIVAFAAGAPINVVNPQVLTR